MTEPTAYGHTTSGDPITDKTIDDLAAEAEAGYDVDQLIARRGKRGRPLLGSAPANVESVRLDPQLRRELTERAAADGTTSSELIREALRRFLRDNRPSEGTTTTQPADQGPKPKPTPKKSARPRIASPEGTGKAVSPEARARPQQAIARIAERPGVTISELATSMGISVNYLYRVLPQLEKTGKITKRGGGYHALADTEGHAATHDPR